MKRLLLISSLFIIVNGAVAQSSLEYYFKAVSAEMSGKKDSAIFFCERSLEINKDTVVMLFKARCQAGSGNYVDAFVTASEVVAAGNSYASFYAAEYASLSGKIEEAFKSLETYLKLPRRLPDNLIKTDSSFKKLESVPEWESLWKNQPDDGWMDLKADVLYKLQRKEYTKLFDVLDQAMEKYSDRDELLYYRYLVYYNTQNYKGALQNLKKAIKINPADPLYYHAYARLMNKQKLYKEASAQYQKYKSLNLYDILIFPEMIDAALEAGEYDIAISYSEYYLLFFRKNVPVLYKQGMALERKKDYNTALTVYTSVLYIDSRYADAYFRRGICYFEQNSWQKACDEFTLTLDLKPRTGEVFYYRGITRLNLNDKVGACHDFERAKSYDYLQATDYMMKFCQGQ